jgi:hypothetical protein
MALDTPPKLTKKRQLAFALETTNGTAASLSGTNAVVPVFNPAMQFATESVERQPEGSLAPIRQGRGARSGTLNFETELFGHAGIGTLLQACGATATSGVYAPVSGATQTATFGMYQDGLLKTLAGAMGTAKIAFRRGQAPRCQWAFQGIQAGKSDAALITPTKSTVIAPRVGGTLTIGGTPYRTDNVDFDLGNVVVLREDVTAATGYRCAYITDRQPRVRLAIESTSVGAKDWLDVYHSSTTVALSMVVGADAGNIWTLTVPTMELASPPTDGDRAGMLTDVLEFIPVATGDSEYSLTLS